ncbi:MAG: TetR family transcriptional regulator [Pseudomonadota bacterium]
MAKKTKEEALATRTAILDAAIDIFYENGVTGACLENIAERAGVTRGAIYWHFRNKLDIFEALHERLDLSIMDTILKDLENNHPDPLQQLENLCVALLADIENDLSKHKILSVFLVKCDYSGDMAVFLDRQHASKLKSIALFSRYFERARQQHHLDDNTDPHTLTLSLSFFLTGIVHEHLRDPALCNLDHQAPRFMRQFFKGVYRRST